MLPITLSDLMDLVTLIQIVLAVLLTALILLQQRGAAMGTAFGGGGEFYGTKRGAEKVLFLATVIVAVLFLGLALANVLFLQG